MKSAWLDERRKTAAETLKKLEPPTSRDEVWRYSDIDELDLEIYKKAGEIEPDSDIEKYLESTQNDFGELSSLLLSRCSHFSGSWHSPEFSDSAAYAGRLVDIDQENSKEVLGGVVQNSVDYFSVMNDAQMVDPLYIHIPAGVHLEKPIGVLELAEADGAKFFPRLVIHIEEGASAKVMHIFQSESGANFSAPIVEISLGSSSNLSYLSVEDLGQSDRQIGLQSAVIGSQANLSLNTISLGGESVRFRTDCRLQGRGASGDILSLYFANQNQKFDFRTFQKHTGQDTNSNLLFKGAVDDSARLIYSGMIRIDSSAKSTNASQANHNLKLSKDAWVESVPNLEIENNDVACSHASTVGPVDEDQRFYLESRGIPSYESERLIVAGFFKEALGRLPFPGAVDTLYERLVSKFSASSHFSKTKEGTR